MEDWICGKCGHEVMAAEKPQPIKWTDGHICYFIKNDSFDDDWSEMDPARHQQKERE